MGAADGRLEWRRKEAQRLSDLVQDRLTRLQHPLHCDGARKLICDLNKNGGFGCQIHHLAHCLAFGYATNRTVVLNSTGWQYHADGWEKYFHPISKCGIEDITGPVDTWTIESSKEVLFVPVIEDVSPKPEFLLPALPEDIAHRVVLFSGNPLAWWVGQLVKYFLRPVNSLEIITNYTIDKLASSIIPKTLSPIVGIHVRRTDKIGAAEAVYHDFEEYMFHVEEYFAQRELMQPGIERRVYIATDDIQVVKDLQQLYSFGTYDQYTFLYEQDTIESAAIGMRNTKESLEGLMTDLTMLASSDYFVCTFSSNIGRLAFELMQTNRMDGALSASSLDDVYYLSNIYAQDRIAVIANAGGDEDISLEVGDQIGLVPGGHRDGYDLGTNKRTLITGLIPWYKTVEDPALYRAPKYDDQL